MTGLEPLTQELIWMALPVILLAALVHGIFGIGFPMVATPLLALFTDVLTAVLITLLPTMAVNLTMIGHTPPSADRAIYVIGCRDGFSAPALA